MSVQASTIIRDVLYTIKNDLRNNITDPIQSSRTPISGFIMTSYPQRVVQYPLITIKLTNASATRAGMQTSAMDYVINLEIRIWARNQKEKDELFTAVLERLRNIQFSVGGTVDADIHEFSALSGVEIDEEGKGKPKSRILEVQYRFYN